MANPQALANALEKAEKKPSILDKINAAIVKNPSPGRPAPKTATVVVRGYMGDANGEQI
jgi:hypothetical protein